jgi:hypothetical protein
MSNLYELTGERLTLMKKLESMNFYEETIADTLEGESTELQTKIESYGFVIRNMESFTDSMKAEETRMSDRRKAHEKRVANIKSWLLQNMQVCGISKIDCAAFTIALKNNPPSVIVDDESAIPADLMRLPEPKPPVSTPDKKEIAVRIKSGTVVAGCHLEQSQRIEIK